MRTTLKGIALCIAVASGCGDLDMLEEQRAAGEPLEATQAALVVDPLESGQPRVNLAGALADEKLFSLVVPAGARNLRFAISGGSGDADLYVRLGASPTRTAWDYRPYLDGNDEVVAPNPIATGTYHVMLRAYRAYAGLTLNASFDLPTSPPPPPPPGPSCGDDASWPAAWVAFEDRVLELTNQHRAAGATCDGVVKPPVGPLVRDPRLRQAARCHSLDMGTRNYFDHTNLDGLSPWQRIANAGYTGSPTAENIAAGQQTAELVVAGWMTSPGHCQNIMGASSTELGVGFASVPGSRYTRYWTQNFGRR
jgi:uncharacterized protein YkwD